MTIEDNKQTGELEPLEYTGDGGLKVTIFIWFVICSAVIAWFGSANKSEFDPKLHLSQSIMSLSFEQELIAQLNEIVTENGSDPTHTIHKVAGSINISNTKPKPKIGQIFHITQGGCYCEWLVKSHVNKIDSWSAQHQFSTFNLNLSQYPAVQKYIPSTPAIIALDSQNKLIYLGPYSRGSGCFTATGTIDTLLAMWVNLTPTLQAQTNSVIDTDANGCYCNT